MSDNPDQQPTQPDSKTIWMERLTFVFEEAKAVSLATWTFLSTLVGCVVTWFKAWRSPPEAKMPGPNWATILPAENRERIRTGIGCGALAMLVCLLVWPSGASMVSQAGSRSDGSARNATESSESILVPTEFATEYKQNSDSASQKYVGKTLRMRGKVESTSPVAGGEASLSLLTNVDGYGVSFFFEESKSNGINVKSLTAGTEVVVSGVCVAKSPYHNDLMLYRATLLEVDGKHLSASDNAVGITLDEFLKVSKGMTYEEVQNILGSKGTILKDQIVTEDKYNKWMRSLVVTYKGQNGATATFTFYGVSARATLIGAKHSGLE